MFTDLSGCCSVGEVKGWIPQKGNKVQDVQVTGTRHIARQDNQLRALKGLGGSLARSPYNQQIGVSQT